MKEKFLLALWSSGKQAMISDWVLNALNLTLSPIIDVLSIQYTSPWGAFSCVQCTSMTYNSCNETVSSSTCLFHKHAYNCLHAHLQQVLMSFLSFLQNARNTLFGRLALNSWVVCVFRFHAKIAKSIRKIATNAFFCYALSD